jgi:hypothetical protein
LLGKLESTSLPQDHQVEAVRAKGSKSYCGKIELILNNSRDVVGFTKIGGYLTTLYDTIKDIRYARINFAETDLIAHKDT